MTARTLSYLNGTLLAPGQSAGAITPARMQDVIDTINARTGGNLGGGSLVRVTDPEFGADPTGVADSTTAFQNAMVAGPTIVPAYQPNGSIAVYKLNNCVVPNGAALMSWQQSYGSDSGQGLYGAPRLVPLNSSTTWLFNVNGKQDLFFSGLYMDGFPVGRGLVNGISGGATVMTIRDCHIASFKSGLGDATGLGSIRGCWITSIENTVFEDCVTGIIDGSGQGIVDTWMRGGSFTWCVNGVTGFVAGAKFDGVRVEWCGRTDSNSNYQVAGVGLHLSGQTVEVTGCDFDSCGGAGIQIDNASKYTNITGCYFQSNGANRVTPPATGNLLSTSAHVWMNGCRNVVVSGCTSSCDMATDGVTNSPTAFINFTGTNTALVFSGNDLSGYTGSAVISATGPNNSNTLWRTGTPPTSTTGQGIAGWIVKGNMGTGTGAQDIDSR